MKVTAVFLLTRSTNLMIVLDHQIFTEEARRAMAMKVHDTCVHPWPKEDHPDEIDCYASQDFEEAGGWDSIDVGKISRILFEDMELVSAVTGKSWTDINFI